MAQIYRSCMLAIGNKVPAKLQPLWKHPAGPQTVFFWGPLFKWGLVFAGIGDLQRHASELSVKQNFSLGISGFIWTRYCLVIIPKNYSLSLVNFSVGLIGTYQVIRAVRHHRTMDLQEIEAQN